MGKGFYSRGEIEGIVQKIRSPNMDFGAGKVFFVDKTYGSDGHDGDNPARPLYSIAHALSLCVSGRNDYILVLDAWQQDTFPISVNKSRVHIIGVGTDGGYPGMAPPGDTAIFTIDAVAVEIARLSLGAGVSHGAIEFSGANGYGAIHDCWFGEAGAGLYGIYIPGIVDAAEELIQNCRFGAAITSDGIRIAHNATRSVIRDCLFRPLGIGINVTAHMTLGWILSNRFVCSSVLAGTAITLTNTDGIFIDDNRAQIGKTVMGVIPYVDGGANHWGRNFQDIAAVLPA